MKTSRRGFIASATGCAAVSQLRPSFSMESTTGGRNRHTDSLGELILEPDLPIIDPHHHLWSYPRATLPSMITQMAEAPDIFTRGSVEMTRRHPRYLLEEFLHDTSSGHNILATVYVETGQMYKADGPPAMRSVGEVEFANGIAAMSASGSFGPTRVCAGIVGGAPLAIGDAVQGVLEAHIQAGGGRYRGVRNSYNYDEDATIFGPGGQPHGLLDPSFRSGFKWLRKLGLSFETYIVEPQLPDLTDLARAFPETQIVLDHLGAPIGVGRYTGKRQERFPIWQKNIRELAKCENVIIKIGGLETAVTGLKSWCASPPFSSAQLAAEWRPYIETAIEAFHANRCMFESDFPVDAEGCTYATLWNAFKRVVAQASRDEKMQLFSGTAQRVYRLSLDS